MRKLFNLLRNAAAVYTTLVVVHKAAALYLEIKEDPRHDQFRRGHEHPER